MMMPVFRCNICGAGNRSAVKLSEREGGLCSSCGSNIRLRSVVLALSRALFNCELPLTDFPSLKTVRGLGFSDSEIYARPLERLFSYSNTYFHREPRFDIAQSDPARLGLFDFVICSEVLEHVAPPVERAFATLRALLKPSGVLILTVPYGLDDETIERFDGIADPRLVTLDGKPLVIGRDPEGSFIVRDDIVFHGGPGATLEMRIFSESALRSHLENAGFPNVAFDAEESPEFGVAYPGPCSLPVFAANGAGNGGFLFSPANTSELLEEFVRVQRKLLAARESRWLRLGRLLGLGPKV